MFLQEEYSMDKLDSNFWNYKLLTYCLQDPTSAKLIRATEPKTQLNPFTNVVKTFRRNRLFMLMSETLVTY